MRRARPDRTGGSARPSPPECERRPPLWRVAEGEEDGRRRPHRRNRRAPRLARVSGVHRKKTKFAARVHRVATAVERRGIVATYELHDRLLANRASRRKFAAHAGARRDTAPIVAALDGTATPPSRSRSSSRRPLGGDRGAGARFTTETELALASDGEGLRRRAGKEFVVRMHATTATSRRRPVAPGLLSRRLLDVANAYLGMWSKLEYVDVWYSSRRQ